MERFFDDFDAESLDERLWLPCYLPQWSSWAASAPRYRLGNGCLSLRIEPDQVPWCPEFNGGVRVSNLQTGLWSGPLGSPSGQHRFNPDCRVRECQTPRWLYTPRYGRFGLRARCLIGRRNVAAFWMIGLEDEAERSAELCVFELKGWQMESGRARIGQGLHPFGDPRLRDDFTEDWHAIEVREFHDYELEWRPDGLRFLIDGRVVRTLDQSPDYPMQFMLNLYDVEAYDHCKTLSENNMCIPEFVVDRVWGRPLD